MYGNAIKQHSEELVIKNHILEYVLGIARLTLLFFRSKKPHIERKNFFMPHLSTRHNNEEVVSKVTDCSQTHCYKMKGKK